MLVNSAFVAAIMCLRNFTGFLMMLVFSSTLFGERAKDITTITLGFFGLCSYAIPFFFLDRKPPSDL